MWFVLDGYALQMWESPQKHRLAKTYTFLPRTWWDMRRVYNVSIHFLDHPLEDEYIICLYFRSGALELRTPVEHEAHAWKRAITKLMVTHARRQAGEDDEDRYLRNVKLADVAARAKYNQAHSLAILD